MILRALDRVACGLHAAIGGESTAERGTMRNLPRRRSHAAPPLRHRVVGRPDCRPTPSYFATAVEVTASLSASARSVLSQVNSGSDRPKWP